MRNLIGILLFFGINAGSAQTLTDLSSLPEGLVKGANAIILKEETAVTVEKLNKVTTQKRLRVVLLNKEGEEGYNTYSAYYDGFNKIRKMEATAYSLKGEVLLKSKNSDIRDEALNPFDNAVTDGRVKSISLDRKQLSLPYILEFNLEEESSETFFYEDWAPVNSLYTAILESSYQIRSPLGIDYRARAMHLDQPSVKTVKDGWKTETWKLENFTAISSERYLPPNSVPGVFIEPVNFQIDKYTGTISSWKDIGDFYLQLNQGRDVLPETIKEKLRQAIGAETDTLKKARRVYEFMQGHTRYFNISFRLGGWQSLPAARVAEKGYGDCKALTNYTLALLKEAGVRAYPALVNSGVRFDYTELDDFPKNAFDHIIACVPTARDTVWLECTSQTNPFGYIGSFTGNRKALLITAESSHLVNTRSYVPEENSLVSATHIRLQKDGSSEISYQSIYSGIQQEKVYGLAWSKDREKQKRWLTGKFKLSDILFDDFYLEILEQGVRETANVKVPSTGSFSGDRFFFYPYVISSFYSDRPGDQPDEQSKEFYLNPNIFSFMDLDTVRLTLPDGFVLENRPKDVRLEAPFGFYESRIIAGEPGQLLYIRKVLIRGGRYPREVHRQWIDFIKAVNRADRQRTVLKRTL